ncbi:SOSS complex subunit B homolog [Leguminivora glycinivorella]|uniref:SOSS complex subunit B homolog n=1 Tax=Leguminivora glycinivorella TaxID=1035111 RepID=UPI00200EA26E|nr:SOSS complex subunit B homolog [Leguminivora glycinivorella]
MGSTDYVAIKDLKPGMKNINAVFIVLEVGGPTLTKEAREVRTLRVADASAAVNLSVWDEPGALLMPGDIVRLTRGYAALWRGALTLYAGKSGDIQKVGEFCMLFNEQVNMSEPQPTPPPPPMSTTPPATTPAQRATPPAVNNNSNNKPFQSDNKMGGHKTYVRGRGHQRNNNRR